MAKVKIDKDQCKGCEYCIIVCPRKALGLGDTLNRRGVKPAVVVRPDDCTGCGLCVLMCPDVCIEVWK